MIYKTTFCCSLIGLLAFNTCQDATAGLVIGFSNDGGNTFSDTFNIGVGESVSVGVYLNETPALPDVDLVGNGLVGFGIKADGDPTTLGTISTASADSQFDSITKNEFTASTLAWEALDLFDPVPKEQSLSLGSFTFDSSSVGSTVFRFADIQPGSGSANTNWLSGAGLELDEIIFGPGATNTFNVTINATAIPEPSSLLLCGAALTLSTMRRRRRIKR